VRRNVSGLNSLQPTLSPSVIDRLVGQSCPVCGVRACLTVGQCLGLGREPDPVVDVAVAREYFGDETHSRATSAAPDGLLVPIKLMTDRLTGFMCSRLRSEIVIILLSDTSAIVVLFPMSASFSLDGPHLVGASPVLLPDPTAESPVAVFELTCRRPRASTS